MKIDTAHDVLAEFHAIAMKSECIHDKVAWALYKTWELAEEERRKMEDRKNGNQ